MIGLGHLRGLGSGGAFAPAAVLDLDFLSGQIDPRLTYARGSQASRIDSAGRVSIAPHNLCLHSEQFHLGWARESLSAFGAGSLVDSVFAPDGARTADVIDDGAGSGRHIIYQARPIPGDGCYAASVFVKDLGRRFVQLLVTPPGFVAGGFVIADLVAGAITQTKAFAGNAPVLSSSIEPAGDGWFRISLCFKVLPGASSLYFIIATSDRPSDASGTISYASPAYAGSGKKLAVWAAQLELIGQEAGVRAYVRSSAVPFYGPRLDHDPSTGAASGLLVEEARTNLILRSQAPSSQTLAVAAQAYTLSFYGSGSIALSGAATGIVSGAGAYPARRTFTFTPAAGALSLAVSGDVSFAQCEAGTFATSWIPTWNTASLRAADDVRFDASSLGWLSPLAGTFFVEASRLSAKSRGDIVHLCNFANSALGEVNASGGPDGALDVSMRTTAGSFNVSSQDALALAPPARAAFAYGADGGAISINGSAAIGNPGVLGLSQVNAMTIGSNVGTARHFLNGHVRRIRHFESRLSNAWLQRMSA